MYLADIISLYSLNITLVGSALLVFLVFLSLIISHLTPFLKKLLFILMISVIMFVTLFLVGSTLYLNAVSVSKGPVHYHADFEIWNCGKEITLTDPEGLSNKIGTPILHEHNDKRVHLEGVVVEDLDASLGRFFEVIGGELTSNFLSVPTNEGLVNLTTGTACPDGKLGTLQLFVYKTIRENYYQQKIMDPKNYIISPKTNVPPGDCIIIEFDSIKEKTEKICRSYAVWKETGKLKGEIMYGN